MTYTVTGGWTEIVNDEYESLVEALAAADRLINDHPDAVFQVNGDGISVHRFTPQPKVEA